MAKCLVTGGAGFIGSHVVDALIARGDKVRVLDNLSTGRKENLVRHASGIELLVGDLRNEETIQNAVRGIDYVFHIAALRAVLRSVDDPCETNEVNVRGTLNLLLAAKEAGVKRVIFSSSSSVYGDTDVFPSREDALPRPQSPYAASKIMGEYYCQIFSRLYGLETVCLRYFNVFGPRQNPESKYSAVIPIFVDCMLKGVSPEIHSDGKQSRDFTYVANVVSGNLLAADAKGVSGEVFNIACHEEFSVLEIFNQLKDILSIEGVEPVFKPKRAGDVRRSFADIAKAQRQLGYKTKVNFRDGLKETVKWFCPELSPAR